MGLGGVEVLVMIAIVGALLGLLLWGNRPTPDRFAAANNLTLEDASRAEVAAALRRTYRGRVVGGGVSFLVALGFATLEGSGLNFARGLAAVLAGTLIGIALAQLTPAPDPGAVRVASLEARDADDYRPRHAKTTIAAALAVMFACGTVALLSHERNIQLLVIAVGIAVLSVGTVALGAFLQRRIVEHAHDRRDPDHARVDVALRASAVRAVHHATVGILLCGIAFLGVSTTAPAKIRVYDETQRFAERGADRIADPAELVFELPGDSTDIKIAGDNVSSRIDWTDANGVRHSRELANTRTEYHLLTTERHYDLPVGFIAVNLITGLLAGIGALLEWRAAAQAWRQPGPRRRETTAVASLIPAGRSS